MEQVIALSVMAVMFVAERSMRKKRDKKDSSQKPLHRIPSRGASASPRTPVSEMAADGRENRRESGPSPGEIFPDFPDVVQSESVKEVLSSPEFAGPVPGTTSSGKDAVLVSTEADPAEKKGGNPDSCSDRVLSASGEKDGSLYGTRETAPGRIRGNKDGLRSSENERDFEKDEEFSLRDAVVYQTILERKYF